MLTKFSDAVARLARNSEVRHDAGLFATALIATGVFDRGAPLTLGAVGAAVTVAVRRVVALRVKALRARKV